MRSILYTIALVVIFGLVAANPTGKYCGNYMGVVDSSLTFNSDSDLTLWINVNGSEATCPNEAYTMAADGTITITNMTQPGNCIGELVKAGNFGSLGIKYDAATNTVAMDVGVAAMKLQSC